MVGESENKANSAKLELELGKPRRAVQRAGLCFIEIKFIGWLDV